MVGQFWEGFFGKTTVVHVCRCSSQLGHIKWHCALVFHFLDFFWINCSQSLGSDGMIERETCTAGQPEGIFLNRRGICDETWYCEPKSDFYKKSGASNEAPAVQFPPLPADSAASYLFPNSCKKGFSHRHVWFFVHTLWPSILEKMAAPHIEARLWRCFTKIPIYGALKMKNQLFVQ